MNGFKTENLSEKYLKIAEKFVGKLKLYPEVIGIIITGGLARGFVDKYSDIDIEFFLHKEDFLKWSEKPPVKTYRRTINDVFLEVEIEPIDYDEATSSQTSEIFWTIENRWDKQNAIIAYDPKGKIKKLIDEKVKFRPNERERLMKKSFLLANWFIDTAAKSWIERGDIVSANQSVNQAIDHLVDYVFLKNKEFIPFVKWKYFYVKKIKKIPQDFSERLDELLLIKAYSQKDVKIRINKLKLLIGDSK
jgi:hypothetical protein